MTTNQAIASAKAEIGTKESPANSNNVKYNTWYYGKSVSGNSYPWCAAFISWLFRNNQALCKKTASCLEMLNWFEKNNQIVKTPRAGDIVFFKYSTNARRTNHVGLVIAVNNKTITTIEGNTSVSSNDNGGAVMQRTRSANIVAYARPKYEDVAIDLKTKNRPTLKKGNRGEDVKELQRLLNKRGYNLKVDGDFGILTQDVVKDFQIKNNLTVDGIVGTKTWNKLNAF